MIPGASWICPACATPRSTPYCASCGERRLPAHTLTLRGLADQVFQAFSNIDGRLIRSFRSLVLQPGALSVAYVQGQRVSYIGPFQLFLMANVLFFAIQSGTNANVFSSTLDSHLHHQDWSALAQSLVARRLESLHTTLELYAPVFDRAVLLHAKSGIIAMVLPFALLLPLLFRRNPRPFVAHVVFSVHLYAFLLLLFCVSLAIAAVHMGFGGGGLASPLVDRLLSILNLAGCATYLYLATGAFYGATGAIRVAQVALLVCSVAAIALGYRFLLFLITLYGT